MGDVDKDTAIAQMMSMTGCEDFDLLSQLLEDNAWCVELAIETYNLVKPSSPGARSNNKNSNNSGASSNSGPTVPPTSSTTRNQQQQHASAAAGGADDGGDIRMVGDFREKLGVESDHVQKGFTSKNLQQMFKAPSYAEKLTKGWREACGRAKATNKYILLNIQDEDKFESYIMDRDVWANPTVHMVATCYFMLVQIWRGGENFRDFALSYPGVEKENFPLVVILDQSMMELKRIPFKKLMTFAGLNPNSSPGGSSGDALLLSTAMSEMLTGFIDQRETMMVKNPSMEGDSTSGDNYSYGGEGDKSNNGNDDEGEGGADVGGGKKKTETTNAATTQQPTVAVVQTPAVSAVPEPSDAVDTLAKYRAAGAGEGILKLRVKLPSATDGSILDWDIFLPKSTPQRAFTRGVRFELRANRASAVPPRSIVRVQRLDRSRKLAEIFAEAAGDATASADEGATLGDVEGMRSGEVLWIELASAAV